VPVIRVFDGDGFLTRIPIPNRGIEIEAGVRLGFIDAPELEQPGGQEAREFLCNQINERWVDLVVLMKMDTGQSVDRHQRIVAVPYLWQDHDQRQEMPAWRNIELEMILNGWAWVLDRYEPPEHYFDALEDAQRNRRGIWARDDNVHPWQFKAQKRKRRQTTNRVSPQQDLFSQKERAGKCPTEGCSGQLIERSGRRGTFYGCSEFPKCRFSRSIG
jgi:micrococcal nuclease